MVNGNFFTGTNAGGDKLIVTDGITTNLDVRKIIVSAGTITASSGHTVTITTGGGGGGGVTTIGFGTTGLTPAAATAGVVTVAGTLVVANGGTGATTLTDGGILLGSGTGAVTALAQATNGQLVIGSTGADPILATLASTGGTVTITNTAGNINLEATGGSGTVTAITAGKDLAGGTITTSGTIDLDFDAPAPSPGGTGPIGFANQPPADFGVPAPNGPPSGNLIGGGWIKVKISGADAWIPYWNAL